MSDKKTIGFGSAVSIGIGGMIGGGIFAVLGLSVELAQGSAPIAFMIAGALALLTSYSYAKLSVAYPSSGGTVEFLNRAMGTGVITGGLNFLLWISYVVMLSLYSYAFGSYGATFFSQDTQSLWQHILSSAAILCFTLLNFHSAKVVGRSEEIIVAIKIVILVVFVSVGFWSIQSDRLAPSTWSSPMGLIAGGMVIFLAYEGFELIANTAEDVKDPKRNLPRAFYTSVLAVIAIYVTVSMVTVGNLSLEAISQSRDYALAESAKPFFGQIGFAAIAVAALFSTSSAINATLYGTSRISHTISKAAELPKSEEKIWNKPAGGLIITAVMTLIITNTFDLTNIATIGSAGFLIIFAAVNYSNFKLYKSTRSKRWISMVGCIGCILALGILLYESELISVDNYWIFAAIIIASFSIEIIYRKTTGRGLGHGLDSSV